MSDRILIEKRDKALAAAALLSSDKSGEVAAAVAAIDRLLPAGLTASALLSEAILSLEETRLAKADPVPSAPGGSLRNEWSGIAAKCLANLTPFNAKEIAFLGSMFAARLQPSAKQMAWLHSLAERVGEVEQ